MIIIYKKPPKPPIHIKSASLSIIKQNFIIIAVIAVKDKPQFTLKLWRIYIELKFEDEP
jgi:hypothetical protein